MRLARRAAVTCALALASFALAGCALEPDVGPPLRELCVNEDSDPDTDVSYSRDILSRIFRSEAIACDECHEPDAETPLGIELSGLDLTDYSTLRGGGTVTGADIVIDGRPCDSGLLQKLSAGPPFGSRMPLDGPPFLSAEQRQLVSDWIAEGARDN